MRRAAPPAAKAANPTPWPSLSADAELVRADGQLLAAFEVGPLNLELLAEAEREASLEGLAALYDAIPRPFQLLSAPTARDPNDHLAHMQAVVAGRRAKTAFASYAALYRELAAAPRRPLRATYLIVGAGSEAELRRIAELVRRVGEERGVELRHLTGVELTELWSTVARVGSEQGLSVHTATGEGVLAGLVFGRRWPSQVPPGWLAGLLATPGLTALSMRVRPLPRAEAMSFMTARLRHVRAGERLATERGEVEDPERERIGATALSARRATQAGQGRIYFADTVLLLAAPDRATLHERIEAVRLEARSQQLDVELASFRIDQAWQSALPGPHRHPLAERNLDTPSLAASLLHTSSDLYEPTGHLYGRQRSSGAPIVLDRFARPSHNAIVLGQTGTGKTMLTGAEMSRCFLRGIRVLGVDPLGDFRRLAEELGGTYLRTRRARRRAQSIRPDRNRDPGAFSAKLAMLSRLVGAMAGGLSRDERPALDRALRGAYQSAHIGPDPSTFDRQAADAGRPGRPPRRRGRRRLAGASPRAMGDRFAGRRAWRRR